MTNESGIQPVEFKCLVLQKPVEDVTKGGIIRPDMIKDKEKYAEMEGLLVAVSPGAFTYLDDADWQGKKPKVGDRIIIAKYAGVRVRGADDVEYVLVNDKDLAAVRP